MRQRLSRVLDLLERAIVFVVVILLLVGDAPAFGSAEAKLERIVGADQFDFLGWELDAFREKGAQSAVAIQSYLDEAQRAQFVVDYLARLRRLRDITRQVDRIYADPGVKDPAAASATQRAERDQLRAEVERLQPTAEAIVQDQIASVLADEGLAVGGHVFPPVLASITPLPNILVISPRDQIKREPGVGLSAGITVDRADAIETAVFDQLDKSALVTPIGGLAVYPSMIIETQDLLFLLQVVAHEWTHHWLFFRPLGMGLLLDKASGGDVLTINETVASLVGDEIGIAVLERYYPEIARRDYPFVYEPPRPVESVASSPPEPDSDSFSFNREMHTTRVQVDEYLSEAHALNLMADAAEQEGRSDDAASLRAQALDWIVKAESYMEERRKVFIDQGYSVRKLNQAYFAFYGSYADEPGASGADPIGPAVRKLRARIPGVADFLNAVASVTTLDDLNHLLAQHP